MVVGLGLHWAGLCLQGASLPCPRTRLPGELPSSHVAAPSGQTWQRPAFTCTSTLTHSLQSQVLSSSQESWLPQRNEGGTAMPVCITVPDAFVPQSENIAEVRRPHALCLFVVVFCSRNSTLYSACPYRRDRGRI